MIFDKFRKLKKSTEEDEKRFSEAMQETDAGFKDKMAMILSAFLVIVLPCFLLLLGLAFLVLLIFGAF